MPGLLFPALPHGGVTFFPLYWLIMPCLSPSAPCCFRAHRHVRVAVFPVSKPFVCNRPPPNLYLLGTTTFFCSPSTHFLLFPGSTCRSPGAVPPAAHCLHLLALCASHLSPPMSLPCKHILLPPSMQTDVDNMLSFALTTPFNPKNMCICLACVCVPLFLCIFCLWPCKTWNMFLCL